MIVSLKSCLSRLPTGLFFFAVLLAFTATPILSAEQGEDFFRDTCVINSPELGSLVLLLKI